MNDVAISYKAKIIEVKDNIKQLETLGVDTTNYRATIEDIEAEIDLKVKECYTIYDKADSNFLLPDSLATVYVNAMNRLDKINRLIVSKYEDYYKIQAKYNELNNKVKNADASNIKEIATEVLELLKNIKKTTTVDYEEERQLVENIYELVYRIIKLELIYTDNSHLLECIKLDDVDVSYVSKLIKEDSEKILTDDEELVNKIHEINKKGFSDLYFLDKDLIILISVINDDVFTKKVKNRFLSQIDSYADTSLKLEKTKTDNEVVCDKINEIKTSNKNIFIKRLRKKLLLLFNTIVLSASIFGSTLAFKQLTKTKTYKTVTTTYDSSLPEDEAITEYLPDTENSISLVEYSPWEEPGYFRNDYKRNVYTYDLSNLDDLGISYDNVEEYLTTDIKDHITVNEEIEVSSEKPADDYLENKYVITQVVQNKSDYLESDNPNAWVPLSIICSLGLIGIDIGLVIALSKTKFKDLRLQKRENKALLVKNKQLLLETNTHINELQDELSILRKSIEKEYAELPSVLQQDKKLKNKMLLLEK